MPERLAGTEPRNNYNPCGRCGWDDHHMIYKCAERIAAGRSKTEGCRCTVTDTRINIEDCEVHR